MTDTSESIQRVKDVVYHNLTRVIDNLNWNIENDVMLYRLSSELIPKATHPLFRNWVVNNWVWYQDPGVLSLLNQIRELNIKHNLHLTLHPGQYTVLNSNKPDVVEKAVLDLQYHYWLLEQIKGEFLVIHVGGSYGDKKKSLIIFVNNALTHLSPIQLKHLAIENDDKTYTLKDVNEVCSQIGARPLFDYHHNKCNPTKKLKEELERAIQMWEPYEKPIKMHLSSGKCNHKDRSHADNILVKDFLGVATVLQYFNIEEVYLMLECKNKNEALLKLREDVRKIIR